MYGSWWHFDSEPETEAIGVSPAASLIVRTPMMSAKRDTAITTAKSIRVHKIAFMAVTPCLMTGV
jgi:hypothetical protein